MNRLNRMVAAFRHGAVLLLPAGWRDWAEAVWAEAHQVPPGLTRLAWRAGGVWMLAREALMPRRIGRAALFPAAAAVVAWAAWPGSSASFATPGVRGYVITMVLLLAGLPLLVRLSNPQIAARMFISRRTVATHLTSIFRKLGISSRAELAVRAARREDQEAARSRIGP